MPPNDYKSYIKGDPIYAQVRLQANRDLRSLLAQKFQQQQQLLMQLGNPSFARSSFQTNPFAIRKFGDKRRADYLGGKLINQMTPYEKNQLKAIEENANEQTGTSAFAKIARAFTEDQRTVNEQMNAKNLFYSGHRGKALGDLTRERQFSEAEALFGANQQMNLILDEILRGRRERRSLLTSAAEQAYQRALAEELAY